MATVFLGNTSPVEVPEGTRAFVNGEPTDGKQAKPVAGKTVVVVVTPDVDAEGKKVSLSKKLQEIRNAFKLHSQEGPAWVESTDEEFGKLLAGDFDCEVGRPKDWDPKPEAKESEYETDGPYDNTGVPEPTYAWEDEGGK